MTDEIKENGNRKYSDAFRKECIAYFCAGHSEKECQAHFQIPTGSMYSILDPVRQKKWHKKKNKVLTVPVAANTVRYSDIRTKILGQIGTILDEHINAIVLQKMQNLLKTL